VLCTKINFLLEVLLANTIHGKPKNKFLGNNKVEKLDGVFRDKTEVRED